jgi:4-amino-4-deoxy-L-arabinose transferase-like glycosyltransferase
MDHPWAAIGFGLSLGIVFIVPCMQVLLLPAGTVGATWLVFEREKAALAAKP